MDISFNHTQSTPASSWTVTHNLGRKPISDVLVDIDGSLQKMLPLEVIHVSNNEALINFTSPRAGVVRFV